MMFRFILPALILLLGSLAIYDYSAEQSLSGLAERSANRLTLFVSNLDGTLDQYRNLPKLLSSNRRLINTLQHNHLDVVNDTNLYLQSVAEATGASDIYLMSMTGDTLAASNWRLPRSFVGRNFSFRPYFKSAVAGEEGRYFALGTTSGQRGYYFSHPVLIAEDIIGVIVVKIDLANLESAWGEDGNHFLVSDDDGVIFLSTRNDWTYHSLFPIAPGRLAEIHASQRYSDKTIEAVGRVKRESSVSDSMLLRIDGREYLQLTRAMPNAGWQVHLLADTRVAHADGRLRAMAAGFALLLVITLVALYLINRQRRLALQFSTELLEQRVQERTRELENEIEVRRRAEQSLRDTQSELIQAAKMAGLGQMSAGIGHELNQPLTAIRNSSENAIRLYDRGMQDVVRENLADINELTSHMARIVSQLSDFSRKSSGERSEISLSQAIDQALEMFRREIDRQRLVIDKTVDGDIVVKTDPVLLNQVLVNIVSNAIQAQADIEAPRLRINASIAENAIEVTITDNGPGIDDEIIDRLFDPFFTTKEMGLGLGLGLSISYRIMSLLDGAIAASNDAEGGACFTLYLPHE